MQFLNQFKFHLLSFIVLGGIVAVVTIIGSRKVIYSASGDSVVSELSALPKTDVALILGCRRTLSNGRKNLFFEYRMDAAETLYKAGTVEYLLVSGDNHKHSYNEPQDMKEALIERGIPEEKIICDYAGFRTLDSVVRAKEVFGQNRLIVVSQEFHNRRAAFIGQHRGLEIYGYNARDVNAFNSFKTDLREELARVKTVLDVWVFRKQPKFLGDPIHIVQNG